MTEYPVTVHVAPATENRNRLTTAFRFFLALPHLILVGGPAAIGLGVGWNWDDGWSWSSSAGLLGHAVFLTTIVMWFAIVITAAHIDMLWRFAAFFVRWRVRATAYLMLLRDEYPPFGEGDGEYPAFVEIGEPPAERDRLTVFFRILLALPHILLLGVLNVLWAFTTAVAWVVILFTGRYPETLYGFALGVLAWSVRVETYVLLLRDEYPPFSLKT
ncbi:MAG TPA: DUF4389 domain-containing protein [Longimicrobiales bacterium]|nr:DUF4389 domain-containing protein [Longimicrobiales bacterium]